MICVIFNQINFDFERSGPFYKNADASHEIKKTQCLRKRNKNRCRLRKRLRGQPEKKAKKITKTIQISQNIP